MLNMRSIVGTMMIALACVALSARLPAQDPDPVPQTTEFLHPLQQHDQKMRKAAAEIDRLYRADDPESEGEAEELGEKVEAAGRGFLKEGRDFQKTLGQFMKGETRRGLDLEIDLIRDGVQTSQEALVTYRQLCNAPFVAISDADEQSLVQAMRTIIEDELRARIAARLEAEGLKDIVDARTWDEARKAVTRQVSDNVRERIEQETERIFGMRFHDRATAKRALRQRINREIERKIEQIFVRITHSKLAIELAGVFVAEWVKDQLWNRVWPEIRESFRQKGRHESRLVRSQATMETARMDLMKLDKAAPIRAVEATIRNARRTVAAARYLRHDLERAGKTDMLDKLEADITWLQKAVSFTQKRFLMHKEDLVNRLKVDQEVLDENLDELERLIKGVDVPTWAENKVFFIQPFQRLTEEGIVSTNYPCGTSSAVRVLGSSVSLQVVDLEAAERARERLAKKDEGAAEMSVYELSRHDSRVVKRYGEPFFVRLVAYGQVRHLHRTNGFQSHLGGGGIFGLRPGEHQLALTIATGDGFRLDETVTVITRAWDESHEKSIEANRKGVAIYQASLEKAETDQELRNAAVNLHGQLVALGNNLLHFSSTLGEEIVPLLRRRTELAALIYKVDTENERRDEQLVSRLQSIVYECARIGCVEAAALALEAATTAEKAANRENRSDVANMVRIWRSMANVAVASSNDLASAHDHLEKWLTWYKLQRPQVDEDRARAWWPEAIALGGGTD